MIEIDKVTYGYDKKTMLFHNLDLQILKSESWGILGFNGAGKSTLIKLLLGIIRPTSGSIQVDGKDIYKARKKLMRTIGVVWGAKPTL